MANEHGYLPKVTELDDKQQRRLDTWYAKAYTDDNLFRTLAADETTIDLFLGWVGAVYGGHPDEDPGRARSAHDRAVPHPDGQSERVLPLKPRAQRIVGAYRTHGRSRRTID